MDNEKWIDITQPLTSKTGHWPGDISFSYEVAFSKEETGSVNIGRISTSLHTGTHIDAPFHFETQGKAIHELEIDRFIGKARLIDATGQKQIDADVLRRNDLDGVERLLIKTRKNNNPNLFPEEVPHVTEDAVHLLHEKGIVLVGVDVPSVDALDSKEMAAHHAFHQAGIAILENAMLGCLEPGNYELIAVPLPIVGGDGSPVRAIVKPIRQGGKHDE